MQGRSLLRLAAEAVVGPQVVRTPHSAHRRAVAEFRAAGAQAGARAQPHWRSSLQGWLSARFIVERVRHAGRFMH